MTGLIWNNSIEVLSLADTNLSPMSAPSLVLLFETNKKLQSIDILLFLFFSCIYIYNVMVFEYIFEFI